MERFGRQEKRINAMGAMTTASMLAASSIGQRNCKSWRDCLGHGSLAAGVGHLEGETAGAIIYSQPVPLGRINVGISFADDDVTGGFGVGFDF